MADRSSGLVDLLERAALNLRAAPDTTTGDVAALLSGGMLPPAPEPSWPLVAALRTSAGDGLVFSDDGLTLNVPVPMLPSGGEEQAGEKTAFSGTTVAFGSTTAQLRTVGTFTDASVAAMRYGNAGARWIRAFLAAATAQLVDSEVAEALEAEAASPLSSMAEALAALGSWPGSRLVVSADPTGASDLRAAGIEYRFDPKLTVSGLAIAPAGVILSVSSVSLLEADQPSTSGVDLNAVVTFVDPIVGADAVKSWTSTS
jgi:hypothetical protein